MQPQNPFQPQPGQPAQPEQPAPPAAYPQNPQPAANYGQPAQQPIYSGAAPQPSANPPSSYPVDYLNQIAAPVHVKKASPFVLFGIIGAILLATGFAFFAIVQATAPPDTSTQLYALQARLETLGSVTTANGSRLTQNKLSSINSTLSTNIKSMQANLKTYMDSKGIKDTKKIAAAKKSESAYAAKLAQGLDDAYLTGTLDRSYSSEMSYQLTILKSKLQKLKSTANSKAFTAFYDANVPSVDLMEQQISTFQSTN